MYKVDKCIILTIQNDCIEIELYVLGKATRQTGIGDLSMVDGLSVNVS